MNKSGIKKDILQRLNTKSIETYKATESRMKLAAKIEDALKTNGLSKKQFAGILGKHPSEITKWLSGTHNFTVDTLIDISKVLGVELISIEEKSTTYSLDIFRYSSFSKIRSTKSKPKHLNIKKSGFKWSNIFE